MSIKFTKMHGIGNDYVYVNCFEEKVENPEELAIRVSDRHFGIGSDGLILICPSDKADAKMRMFNLDGSEGKMCGNGIRCVAKYVYDSGISTKNIMTIETLSGIKTLEITAENGKATSVKVDMGKAILKPELIPAKFEGDIVISEEITIDNKDYKVTLVSMGNPHCIVFVDDVDNMPLDKIGPFFEKSDLFPESINTEFVKIIDENTVQMRVWERGSGETLACGTGACAVAVACTLNGYFEKGKDVIVKLVGGDLVINYTDETVFMTGGCTTVFTGEID